jgi:hypothetical protein
LKGLAVSVLPITALPPATEGEARHLNSETKPVTSLHRKEPTGLLVWGALPFVQKGLPDEPKEYSDCEEM